MLSTKCNCAASTTNCVAPPAMSVEIWSRKPWTLRASSVPLRRMTLMPPTVSIVMSIGESPGRVAQGLQSGKRATAVNASQRPSVIDDSLRAGVVRENGPAESFRREATSVFGQALRVHQVLTKCAKLRHLPIDLGEVGFADRRNALAGLPAGPSQAEDFTGLVEAQTQPLRATNESQLVENP